MGAIEMFQPKRSFLFRASFLICVSFLSQSALAQVDCETTSEKFVKITVKNFSNRTLGSFGDLRASSNCNVPEVIHKSKWVKGVENALEETIYVKYLDDNDEISDCDLLSWRIKGTSPSRRFSLTFKIVEKGDEEESKIFHSVDLWNDATQYPGQSTLGEMYSNVNDTYHHQMSKVVEEFCLTSKVNGNPKESCLLATFEASIFDKSDVRCSLTHHNTLGQTVLLIFIVTSALGCLMLICWTCKSYLRKRKEKSYERFDRNPGRSRAVKKGKRHGNVRPKK